MQSFYQETYNEVTFTNNFIIAEYENCVFNHCNFTETSLAKASFLNCEFNQCNFHSTNISLTNFKEVYCNECSFFGLMFEQANSFLFEIHFKTCHLKTCSFLGVSLKNSSFQDSKIINTDFTNANLSQLNLKNCNLEQSIFENAILEKTNFTTAQNFSIDLSLNRVKKAKFSSDNLKGLLDTFDIEID